MQAVSQMVLVILAGIYAMRFSAGFFGAGFTPLSALAAVALGVIVVFFYRWPTEPGLWLYTSMALCLLGVWVNAKLLLYPDTLHSGPTAIAFSGASVIGWVILFGRMTLQLVERLSR